MNVLLSFLLVGCRACQRFTPRPREAQGARLGGDIITVPTVLTTDADVCSDPALPSPALPGGGLPFVLDPTAADALADRWGCNASRLALARALVPFAIAQHQPANNSNASAPSPFAPISGYRVGMVGVGASGKVYLGVNLEFEGTATLGATVHGEQLVVALAALHGESALHYLVGKGGGYPCGHCRQFLSELVSAPQLIVAGTLGNRATLSTIFPDPFGPAALNNSCPLLTQDPACTPAPVMQHEQATVRAAGAPPVRPRLRGVRVIAAPLTPPATLMALAFEAARTSYAPYSRDRSGVALSARCANGSVALFHGGVIESVAYNPTLPPLQVALAAMLAGGLRDFSAIEDAVLAEAPQPRVTGFGSAMAEVLRAIAPSARLYVVQYSSGSD